MHSAGPFPSKRAARASGLSRPRGRSATPASRRQSIEDPGRFVRADFPSPHRAYPAASSFALLCAVVRGDCPYDACMETLRTAPAGEGQEPGLAEGPASAGEHLTVAEAERGRE